MKYKFISPEKCNFMIGIINLPLIIIIYFIISFTFLGIIGVAIFCYVLFEPFRNLIVGLYSYALYRVKGVWENRINGGEGSARLHYRYYWSVPYILGKIDILRMLFGFGKNCSGIPFIKYYGQYKNELWVPESDPIATLYDVGVVGFMAMYTLLCKIAMDLWKAKRNLGLLMASFIIGGVFYGFQMTWVLLLEFMMWGLRGEEG